MKKSRLYRQYIAGELKHALSDDERREILKGYHYEFNIIGEMRRSWPNEPQFIVVRGRVEAVYPPGPPALPPYPEIIRGLTCGAKTRKGTPCKLPADAWGNGRCKFHGGLSTGPKTPEGKRRAAENGKKLKKNFQKLNKPAED